MAKFARRRLVVGGDDDGDDGGGKSEPHPEGLDKHYRVPLLFMPPSCSKNIGLTNVEFFSIAQPETTFRQKLSVGNFFLSKSHILAKNIDTTKIEKI